MSLWKSINIGLRNRLLGTLLCLDEEGNVLWGKSNETPSAGNPHETISDRLYWMRKRGSKFACVFCKVLTIVSNLIGFPTSDHCQQAVQGVPEKIATDG